MNAKQLYLFLFIFTAYTTLHSMEKQPAKPSLPEEMLMPIPEIWLNIIAQCPGKEQLQRTCTYFHECASTKNREIFLQNSLIIKPQLLEELALYYADLNDNAVICSLLNQGLDPNTRTDYSGWTLLHYAIKNENLSLCETLLSHPQFIPAYITCEYYQNGDNKKYIESPFQLALECKDLRIAKHLLTIKGISPNEMLSVYRKKNISDATCDILAHILSMDIDRTKINYTTNIDDILFLAIDKNQQSVITLVLNQKDIDINLTGRRDKTPLCQAAMSSHIPVLKLLIDRGAHLHDALRHAINQSKVHNVQFLLNAGANINERDQRGWTLLAQAIDWTTGATCKGIVQLLLAKGADVNEVADNEGNVALGLIANRASSCKQAIPILLAHPDINVHIKNNKGNTPLDLAYEVRDRRKNSLDVPDWDYLIEQIKQHTEKNQ